MTRYRSYDFTFDRDHYVEGEGVGYAVCSYHPTEPREVFTSIADLSEADGRCVHLILAVDTECEAWRGRGDRSGYVVYPALAEDGQVVPLPAEETAEGDAR